MKSLFLKPRSRSRAASGHPWAFASDFDNLLPDAENGKAVALRDSRKRFLGSGIFNNKSQIVWRRYTSEKQGFTMSFIREAIAAAVERRQPADAQRLIWSESDHLPGLVVDQYGDVLVIQALTLAIDMRLPAIADTLKELLEPSAIVIRNDAPVRKLEGLELEVKTHDGNPLEARWFEIGGIEYYLDLQAGQKTGFYLDQREEHEWVKTVAKGRRVLDAFCNQGAFALNAAKAGATSVIGIDSSEVAIESAKKNATKNGVQVDFKEANVFDYFTNSKDLEYDLIILDPPPFAKNKSSVEGALRGYKEINLRALKTLTKGGILATYTCSHAVSAEVFENTVREAAWDAGKSLRVLRRTTQSTDHSALLSMPESAYLNGLVLEVI